jgi:hypothetical protein
MGDNDDDLSACLDGFIFHFSEWNRMFFTPGRHIATKIYNAYIANTFVDEMYKTLCSICLMQYAAKACLRDFINAMALNEQVKV